jgi:hypothetical protein
MAQVIIYQNPEGPNVCVCTPSGEVDIQTVLEKDCPSGAIIVDDSTLPQGDDAEFFDAWVLNGSTVTVNIEKAKTDRLKKYNYFALQLAQKRQLNTLAGIENDPDDATFQAKLTSDRAAISACTTTQQLLAIQDLS